MTSFDCKTASHQLQQQELQLHRRREERRISVRAIDCSQLSIQCRRQPVALDECSPQTSPSVCLRWRAYVGSIRARAAAAAAAGGGSTAGAAAASGARNGTTSRLGSALLCSTLLQACRSVCQFALDRVDAIAARRTCSRQKKRPI